MSIKLAKAIQNLKLYCLKFDDTLVRSFNLKQEL